MTLMATKKAGSVPPLLKLENIPWVVFVTREAVDGGFDLDNETDRLEMDDLWEQMQAGKLTEEEYHERIGPERGYHPVDIYGPYTQRQAEALAEYLSHPEVAAEHGVTTVVPGRLTRFIA